jgi:hypothetical protein
MLKDVALTIIEDATGATEVDWKDRRARIDSAAARLVDYVHEALAGHGVGMSDWHGPIRIPYEAYTPIERIVAAAMIAQYEYDREQEEALIQALTSDDKSLEEIPV